jgi:cyclopropane fatty-acyl-phospholipid synthase-like methyltransferase
MAHPAEKQSRFMDSRTLAQAYDAMIATPRLQRLYGESGYFNVGYWENGATGLADACDRLVDKVAAFVPRDAAIIVDVGCGLGAGTRRLANRFPDAQVIATNISFSQLGAARSRGVELAVAMDAVKMAIGTGTVDAVLAIESAPHFDTRMDFFAEAYRVLRPGGVLAVADILYKDRASIDQWLVPVENRSTKIGDYAAALGKTDFAEVTVEDVTAATWLPYCAAMRAVFDGEEASLEQIKQAVSHYVVASGRRPS